VSEIVRLTKTELRHYNPEKSLQQIAAIEAVIRLLGRRINSKSAAEAQREEDIEKLKEASAAYVAFWANYICWRDSVVVLGRPEKISDRKSLLPPSDPGDVTAHRQRKKLCTKDAEGRTIVDEEKAIEAIEEIRSRTIRLHHQEPITTVRGTEGTGEFERYTPARYIEAVRKVLGEIDVDPATCAMAQNVVRAKMFFTAQTDGLSKEWRGRIFLNPPYHRDLAPRFIRKLVEEIDLGHVTAAIVLTNNCTDTDWFDAAFRSCSSLCFTHGRIGFLTPPIGTEVFPTQGQTFFYFGNEAVRFEDVFCTIGFCVQPTRNYENCK